MKARKETDFSIDLEGVGRFTFGRRTLGDSIAIAVERATLRRGMEPSEIDDETAGWTNMLATLKVLCVSAPEGWDDLTAIDLAEHPDAFDHIFDLWTKLIEKEDSFRGAAKSRSTEAGQGSGADVSVLVP